MDPSGRPYGMGGGMARMPHAFVGGPRATQLLPARVLGQAQGELKPNFYNPYHVKHRRRTTKEQLALLEATFKATPKPTSETRKTLASRLCMTAREVQIWFQNRRAKQKNMLLRASAAQPDGAASPGSSSPPASATSAPAMSAAAAAPVTSSDVQFIPALMPPRPARASSADRPAAQQVRVVQPREPQSARRHSDIPVPFMHDMRLGATALATAASGSTSPGLLAPGLMSPGLVGGAEMTQASVPGLVHVPDMPSSAPGLGHAPDMAPGIAGPSRFPTEFAQMSGMPPGFAGTSGMAHAGFAGDYEASTSRTKKKRDGESQYHGGARVHQEAFDGTNKLPVKPDDLSPATDEQLMLDPASLPSFMMPPALGSVPSLGNDLWMPYGAMPQNVPPPQSDISSLLTSLMGMAPCPAPSAFPMPSDVVPAPDAAFYQSLLMMGLQAPPKDDAPAAMFMPTASFPQMPRTDASMFAAPSGGPAGGSVL